MAPVRVKQEHHIPCVAAHSMPEAPSVSAPSSVPSTAPGPEDGDVSAASAGGKKKQTMLGEFFGGCKERYNKFNYRFGQMGEEAKTHYKEIQATSDNSEVLAFIEDVIQSKGSLLTRSFASGRSLHHQRRVLRKAGSVGIQPLHKKGRRCCSSSWRRAPSRVASTQS